MIYAQKLHHQAYLTVTWYQGQASNAPTTRNFPIHCTPCTAVFVRNREITAHIFYKCHWGGAFPTMLWVNMHLSTFQWQHTITTVTPYNSLGNSCTDWKSSNNSNFHLLTVSHLNE